MGFLVIEVDSFTAGICEKCGKPKKAQDMVVVVDLLAQSHKICGDCIAKAIRKGGMLWMSKH